MQFIKEEKKNNEVDEIIENIKILYDGKLFAPLMNSNLHQYKNEGENNCNKKISVLLIDETPFLDIIKQLSDIKLKCYPSLSKKSVFKFMDILEQRN